MSDKIDGSVDNVAFGGEAVLHTSEGVVFVHDALPSEFISAKITQQKKRFSRGVLLAIENPHPQRIAPKCPVFSVCGGCHLQHADYTLQTELKRQWLHDSLQRIGGFSSLDIPPIAPAKNIWGYRRHITFHLKQENGHYQAVFHGRNPSVSVKPLGCPLFSEHPFTALHDALSKIPYTEEGRVQIMKIEGEKRLYTFHFKKEPKGSWEILKLLLRDDPHCAGVKLKSLGKCHTVGAEEGTLSFAGMTFFYSPDAFVQTHPDQSAAIYQKISSVLQNEKRKHILDLYGGIGVTACLIAREGAKVTSVELSRGAVELAKRNFQQNLLENGEFICADVAHYLKKCKFSDFDLIIANPPREGIAPEPLKQIAESKKDILMISCMPTTLARDLKVLASAGYSLKWVQGYDMFPQTTHLETIAYLKCE